LGTKKIFESENLTLPISWPGYQDAKDIYESAKASWVKYSKEKATTLFYRTQEFRESPQLIEFLCWKYRNYPILTRAKNVRYPVAVFGVHGSQQYEIESILSKPLRKEYHKEDFKFRDARFRALASKIGLPLQNKMTYDMLSLENGRQLKITCRIGYYYDMLDTCFSLYWEILSQFEKANDTDRRNFEKFDKKLELRRGLHSAIEDPVRNGVGRSNAIGISTLIAYNDGGVTKLWVKRRSSRGVAVYPQGVSVMPSGMFQPLVGFVDNEYSIRNSIFREYLEELFSMPEGSGEEAFDYFYEDPRLKKLTSMIGSEQARLFLTGISIDLYTLRPEISTLLWIKSPEWFSHHSRTTLEAEKFRMNQEIESGNEKQNVAERRVVSVPFSNKDDDLLKYEYLSPAKMTPIGAGTLWLGIDKLRSILKRE
jgi:hypothetical protein